MKKLTEENIQFIQNYLKNSAIEYDDVLTEMTDHVASELETRLAQKDNQGFYEEFKQYMVQHKKSLLDNVGKFRKKAFKRVAVLLLKNLLTPTVLISSFIIGLILFFIPISLAKNMMYILLGLMILEVILFIGLYWKIKIKKGKKYSCLVSLALVIGWFNQFYFQLFNKVALDKNAFILLMVFVLLNASFLVSSIQLAKYYRKNYQLS
ncbi:hypothetical protein [Mesonia aquimarina]|uniref:hypothetical protein n=1 Tax=Mesonia aquimarina TaxID=1504967 RepID=UPI000EF62807|nr:hypothetical protein [Mesonia aquimarina]